MERNATKILQWSGIAWHWGLHSFNGSSMYIGPRECIWPYRFYQKDSSVWVYTSLLENCTLPSAWDFAECFLSGHSAKKYFAECRTRQNKALGKRGFAERHALGKAWLSANLGFAECRGTRQKSHSAKGGRPVTAGICRQTLPSA